MIGRTLSHYHVTEKLGAGGMGEVYRARDTRLNRDVAIKVLPAIFAQDRDRLMRFEREAQLLAQLNHPNIAAIYGFEDVDGAAFLVLEYVPGKNLEGPLSLEDALPVVHQIIHAVEEAHEKGIVHRDLKPGNIRITPEGKVKVLDFGLAKALADETPAADPARSPTMSALATRAGVILGTAAYMSPEQARGRPLDKRTDIWSFGCVLYELLTGRQAFGHDDVTDTIAAIVRSEPDWSALPPDTPPHIRALLERCLRKEAARRLRDIGEARILMDEPPVELAPAPAAAPEPAPAPAPPPKRQWLPWAVAAVALLAGAGVAAWALLRAPKPVQRPVTRLVTALPDVGRLAQSAISRDGTRLAFRAGSPTRIYLRMMDQIEAKPIAGTENPVTPFFSPDGQWIGFMQDGKLKKVQVVGGATMTLCDASSTPAGASWGADGNIIFGGPAAGLARVSAAGGKPQTLTTPDAKKGERSHRWPAILPGGQAVLFTIEAGAGFNDARIAVLTLQTREHRVLVEGGTRPGYVPTGPGPDGRGTGHIVYHRTGSLFAVPFDLDRLQVLGSPVPILEGVAGFVAAGVADYTFSDSGALVYTPGRSEGHSSLVWVDRQGQAQPLPATPQSYLTPRLSPDGLRVAVSMGGGDQADIWVYDLERKTLTRLTFQGGAQFPAWTPDGKRVTFYASRGTERKEAIYSVAADGSSPPQALAAVDTRAAYLSWSPDGKTLAFTLGAVGQTDLVILPAEGDRKVKPFLRTQAQEVAPEFSPDGRWIAYTSRETGRSEIYVRPAPAAAGSGVAAGAKWQVSNDGGRIARWARGGRELFYFNSDKMMAVEIEPGPAFRARTPKMLFEGPYQGVSGSYDVTADGKRFLMLRSGAGTETGPAQVHVVLEWFEEIRRRVRAGG